MIIGYLFLCKSTSVFQIFGHVQERANGGRQLREMKLFDRCPICRGGHTGPPWLSVIQGRGNRMSGAADVSRQNSGMRRAGRHIGRPLQQIGLLPATPNTFRVYAKTVLICRGAPVCAPWLSLIQGRGIRQARSRYCQAESAPVIVAVTRQP